MTDKRLRHYTSKLLILASKQHSRWRGRPCTNAGKVLKKSSIARCLNIVNWEVFLALSANTNTHPLGWRHTMDINRPILLADITEWPKSIVCHRKLGRLLSIHFWLLSENISQTCQKPADLKRELCFVVCRWLIFNFVYKMWSQTAKEKITDETYQTLWSKCCTLWCCYKILKQRN